MSQFFDKIGIWQYNKVSEINLTFVISMDQKKQYLIKILETLTWVWTPATWFLIVLKAWGLDETIVDTLITLIQTAIKETDNILDKQKLEWSLQVLEKVKSMEEKSMAQDAKECDRLLEELDNIA